MNYEGPRSSAGGGGGGGGGGKGRRVGTPRVLFLGSQLNCPS